VNFSDIFSEPSFYLTLLGFIFFLQLYFYGITHALTVDKPCILLVLGTADILTDYDNDSSFG